MSKKTTDQKTEKQTEAKKPVVLKDDELDTVEGGAGGSAPAGTRPSSAPSFSDSTLGVGFGLRGNGTLTALEGIQYLLGSKMLENTFESATTTMLPPPASSCPAQIVERSVLKKSCSPPATPLIPLGAAYLKRLTPVVRAWDRIWPLPTVAS